MLRNRIRTGVLVAGGAVIAVLLTACNTGDSAGSSPDVPTISDASSAQPAPTTDQSQQPTNTAPAQQAPPASSAPAAPAGNDCKVADLNLHLGQSDGAAGTLYQALIFTNKGGRTCTIQGFPGVSYVAGDDGHQVGPAAYRDGTKGPVITLHPGDSAFATVGFVQVQNYDQGACHQTEVRGLRIYPPHDYDSTFVARAGTGCASTPPGNQLTITTVKVGTGPA